MGTWLLWDLLRSTPDPSLNYLSKVQETGVLSNTSHTLLFEVFPGGINSLAHLSSTGMQHGSNPPQIFSEGRVSRQKARICGTQLRLSHHLHTGRRKALDLPMGSAAKIQAQVKGDMSKTASVSATVQSLRLSDSLLLSYHLEVMVVARCSLHKRLNKGAVME